MSCRPCTNVAGLGVDASFRSLSSVLSQPLAAPSEPTSPSASRSITTALQELARGSIAVSCTDQVSTALDDLDALWGGTQPPWCVHTSGAGVSFEGSNIGLWSESIATFMSALVPLPTVVRSLGAIFSRSDIHVDLGVRISVPCEQGADIAIVDAVPPTWTVTVDSGWAYLLPAGVNKGTALRLVAQQTRARRVVAAGSNATDISMLRTAHRGLVAAGSELEPLAEVQGWEVVGGARGELATNLVSTLSRRSRTARSQSCSR